jgi:hypothetical protein
MSEDNSFEMYSLSNVCDASGCFSKATEILEVQVGDLGKVSLSLCKRCRPKFDTIPVNHTISRERGMGDRA